ncbi:MAG: agmatine deiminase family protein [Deltaproteobacteria bacterium]|nr:agmatine deiminase family protein [Deltaproteobacteria bacterium]
MLPAWPTPSENTVPGKADTFSDFRAEHPDWYAATEPPKDKTFRAFLEWEPTQILLLAYPSAGLETDVTNSIAMLGVHAAPYAEVWIVSKPEGAREKILQHMKDGGLSQNLLDTKIKFFDFEADSIWMIDYGPFPLLDDNGVLAFTDLRYYSNRVWDDAIPARIAQQWGITDYRGQMDFEGGNFITDGDGLCYATQGMYWENGNDIEGVNQVVKDYLGCEELVIIQPLKGEGTTHIDMLYKLVRPNLGVLGKYTEAQDADNAKLLDDNADILNAVVPPGGGTMKTLRIPMPPNSDGAGKVWRTYTNSTFVKPVNMWPVYTDYQDLQAEALDVWQTAMPSWEHPGILSDVIITWGGAMHCVSRNIPAGTFEKWIPDGTCVDGTCDAPLYGYLGDCDGDADCYGPDWLCKCNDCAAGCAPVPDKCGGITYDGCCTTGGDLQYCEDNEIMTVSCGETPCGWDPDNNWYDCEMACEGPDGYPGSCPGQTYQFTVTEAGSCVDDILNQCVASVAQTTDCAADGKVCGEDPANPGTFGCMDEPCVDECQEGDAQCLDYPGGRAICQADAEGCLKMVETPCVAGLECLNGQCGAPPQPDVPVTPDVITGDTTGDTGTGTDLPGETGGEDDGGSSGCSASGVPSSSWPALALLPLFAILIRRRMTGGTLIVNR